MEYCKKKITLPALNYFEEQDSAAIALSQLRTVKVQRIMYLGVDLRFTKLLFACTPVETILVTFAAALMILLAKKLRRVVISSIMAKYRTHNRKRRELANLTSSLFCLFIFVVVAKIALESLMVNHFRGPGCFSYAKSIQVNAFLLLLIGNGSICVCVRFYILLV